MRVIRRDPNVSVERIYTNTGHFRRIVKEVEGYNRNVVWEEKKGTIPVSWEQVTGDRREDLEEKYQKQAESKL